MTVYRKGERSADDLETDALLDLVTRMKRFRRRVALPVLVLAMVAAWAGSMLHAFGYWSVFGTSGDFYLVSTGTFVVAAVLCAAPVLLPGVAVYVALRSRLRHAWITDHEKLGVEKDFLARSSRRYG